MFISTLFCGSESFIEGAHCDRYFDSPTGPRQSAVVPFFSKVVHDLLGDVVFQDESGE